MNVNGTNLRARSPCKCFQKAGPLERSNNISRNRPWEHLGPSQSRPNRILGISEKHQIGTYLHRYTSQQTSPHLVGIPPCLSVHRGSFPAPTCRGSWLQRNTVHPVLSDSDISAEVHPVHGTRQLALYRNDHNEVDEKRDPLRTSQ